jgi:DNA-3-methyladenine glycosylase
LNIEWLIYVDNIYKPIELHFYERDTVSVARDLLGKNLVRRVADSFLIGRIVETEAYRGSDDPASHSFRGMTKRNEVMFGKPGKAYVYFTYGNHYCLNIVTEEEGVPAAVLIRAVEPLERIEEMRKNRGVENILEIASGPGKLTRAFQITKSENGSDITKMSSLLTLCEAIEHQQFEVVQTTRIGIKVATELPWRFYIQGNPYISRK